MIITRRDLLVGGAVAPGLLGLTKSRRPNILWISCEDMSPVIGCYGDPNGIAPTLDRLAAQGVRYANAYTVAGVCAPSRSAIITGMYPSTLGTHHMRCQAKLPDFVKCFPEYLREAGYYCTNNAKTDYNFPAPRSAWDQIGREAHWRGRPSGRPFFAVFNLMTTHEGQIRVDDEEYASWTARLNAGQRQDVDRVRVPPYHPDTPKVRRDWARFYELVTAMDYQVADVLAQLETDGLAGETIVFFWSDHGTGLPRAKRWLYDSGTRVPLIMRLPEKFRTGRQGDPGSVDDQLISFIDLAPTVLNLAGIEVPAHMQGRAFLGPNLTPPREYIFSARDRMDERYDIIRAVRDKRYRYIRNYESFKPYYQHMRTPEGGPTMKELRRLHAEGRLPAAAEQFMADRKPVEELYDLRNDLHEVRNLAGSAQHHEVLERMRTVHCRWMDETRDLGLLPEADTAERERGYGGPSAILGQSENTGLLPRLRVMVELSERGAAALPKLVEALEDRDPAVRYWAATGLGNMGETAGAARSALLTAMRDDSASVRVAAARAVCALGMDNTAIPALIRELENQNEWACLSAAIVLDELGGRAASAEGALRRIVMAKSRPDMGDWEIPYPVRVVEHTLKSLTR